MKRSAIQSMPDYFGKYIILAEDIDLKEALHNSLRELEDLDVARLQAIGDKVYAPGKWTVRDIIQHITDTERVFAYRALRIGRGDTTPLTGFEQDLFAGNAKATGKGLVALLNELKTVRQSSIMLFDFFGEEELQRSGICSHVAISVLAIGFTIIGHGKHHLQIIKERYFPLAGR